MRGASLRLGHQSVGISAAALVLLASAATLSGQLIYEESFSNNTAPGWTFAQNNSTPNARLTAGLLPSPGDPEYFSPTTPIDNDGAGWLRLATNTGNQANTAVLDTAFSVQGASITVAFDFAFWKPGVSPADGMTAFFWDASQPFNGGAEGGSLGYAQKTNFDGLGGAYFGVGLDIWGNFSNPTEGRIGGPGQLPGQVAVRGEGSGPNGYNYLAGTNNGSIDSLTDIFGPSFRMDFINSPQRPDQDAADFRRFELELDSNDNLTVRMQSGFSGDMTELFTVLVPGIRPDQLRFGFSAGTGGSTQVYEIRNLSIQVAGGSNAFYWDNGVGDMFASSAFNWDKDSVPVAFSHVYFTDNFPATQTAQTVNLDVGLSVSTLTLSGNAAYSLGGSSDITFDTDGKGTSYLNVLNSPTGNANHSVSNALVLANDLKIQNLIANTLTLSGTINNSGNDLEFNTATSGQISATGVISGAGDVLVSGDGLTRFTASNTYTGSTTVSGGTLRIENSNALGGSPYQTATVLSGASLALSSGIATPAGQNLAIAGVGAASQGALVNTADNNTFAGFIDLTNNATIASQSGELFLSRTDADAIRTGSGYNLTFNAAAGSTIRVAGGINETASGSTELIKTGLGRLQLEGASAYDGITSVQGGTLAIYNNSALGSTTGSAAVSSGATLELMNARTLAAGQTLSIGGSGDTGKAALWQGTADTSQWNGTIALTDGGASMGAVSGGTLRVDGVVSGVAANLTVEGTGTVELRGVNTYTGATIIESGTLSTVGSERLSSSTVVSLSDTNVSTFRMSGSGNTETVGNISGGAGGGSIDLQTNNTLRFGANNADSTFAGSFTSTTGGTLIKQGTGTTTLTGSSTGYTGNLNLAGGTLALGASHLFTPANTTLTLNGGSLDITGISAGFSTFNLSAGGGNIDFGSTAGSNLTLGAIGSVATSGFTLSGWTGNLYMPGDPTYTPGDNAFRVDQASISGDMSTLASTTTFEGFGAAVWAPDNDLTPTQYFLVPDLTPFFEWDSGVANTDDRWGTNANWVGDSTPPNWGRVHFGDLLDAGAETIDLRTNQARSVSTLLISSATDTTFVNTQGGRLEVNNNGFITIIGTGDHTFATPIRNRNTNQNSTVLNNGTGSLTISGQYRVRGGSVTFAGTGLTIVSGVVNNDNSAGAGSIIKNGIGTLRLTAANTHSTGTTLNAGILQIGNNSALGTGTFTINGGEIQAFDAARTVTNSLTINEDFTVSGSHNLTFGGTQNVSLTGTRAVTVDNVTLAFASGKNLQGTGALVKEGDGTLLFQGANHTFSGGLTVNEGTVAAGTSATRINNTLRFGGGSAANAYLGDGNIAVNLDGNLEVWKTGTGNIDFRNNVSLTNTGGTVLFDSDNATASLNLGQLDGNSAASIVNSAGTSTFNIGNDVNIGRNSNLQVTGGTTTFNVGDDFTTQGVSGNPAAISVTGGTLDVNLQGGANSLFSLGQFDTLNVTGPGTMNVTRAAGTGNAVATLAGATTVANGGNLTFSETDVLVSATAQVSGGTATQKGTLTFVDSNFTINSAAAVGNAPNLTFDVTASNTRILDGEAANTSFTNIGVLTKTGSGTLELGTNLNNIQANKILINAGTLLNGDSDQIENFTSMELAGGTWNTGGHNEILGSLTLSANSYLDLGSSGTSVIQFADSSSVSWVDGELYITNWSGDSSNGGNNNAIDQIRFANSGLTEGQLGRIFFVNPSGFDPGVYPARIINFGTHIEVVPIPEPSTWAIGALLVGFALYRERRRIRSLFSRSANT
jgi:fibronectin-binding autotransporter adhesin